MQKNDTQHNPKTLPHNLEAEQALLGAILIHNVAYEKVSEFLHAEHFFHPAHQKIYDALSRLIERGQLANPTTLKTFLEHAGVFEEVGGVDYLAELAYAAISLVNASDYGKIIHDLFLRRQLILIGEEVVENAGISKIDESAKMQIEATEQRLFDLVSKGDVERGFQPFSTSLTDAVNMAEAAYKRDGKLTGLATNLMDLDRMMGGLHQSDLLILAGRPSMGKTALATNIAFNIAKSYRTEKEDDDVKIVDGGVVGFFSLEMSAAQLATRILAEAADIPSENLRKGTINTEEFQRLAKANQDLAEIPLYIDDTPALSVSALRTRARRLKRQKNLSMIVIDYLQLMQANSRGRGDANRVNEISEITRGLKAIAKELDIPVIALSQLSRAVELRDDKRPQLSDLRESGSIEQDADIVMFVFRQQYYLERAEPVMKPEEDPMKFQQRYVNWQEAMSKVMDTAEVIVAKQRHGPVGKVTLRFDGRTTKFDNFINPDQLTGAA